MNLNGNYTEHQLNEYQVIIKLPSMPHPLRLTYNKKNTGIISQIEELDAAENVRCSCRFKGRTKTGDAVACDWMYDVRKAFNGMKPKDWLINDEYFIDSHYKIN